MYRVKINTYISEAARVGLVYSWTFTDARSDGRPNCGNDEGNTSIPHDALRKSLLVTSIH